MLYRFVLSISLVAAVLVCTMVPASAVGLPSAFVFQGTTSFIFFDGAAFNTIPYDVYHLEVQNNSGQDLFTMDNVSFSGTFLQNGVVLHQDGTALQPDPFDGVVPPVGDNFVADTFFSGNGVNPTAFGASQDTVTDLSVTTLSHLGTPWIAIGNTAAVAVFSVPNGSPALDVTNYNGGGFITGSVVTPLMFIPEPTSIILASLGLIGIVGSRRWLL